ncbi:rhomboid family intramembrane serine protease [Thiohalophilus sp.]|uniref:rhomboid family intramembrane serine protease n=1 Tax=Thiohalophilus sp. TaxID=3028392 RepID=UPI002ACE4477|nr:rhomboid family intramembrane serine protease [Thiohalophilus sp.]MDZ7661646.1 rhomboid family intramembrane serine protease [Thiohalophilus sp.]
MFLLLPYKLAHPLHRRPWVTWTIALLCLLIYYLQSSATVRIEQSAAQFCAGDHGMTLDRFLGRLEKENEFIESTASACQQYLVYLHSEKQPDSIIHNLVSEHGEELKEAGINPQSLAVHLSMTYHDFADQAPLDLTRFLSYRAGSFNPFSSFLSAFAHADWWHVIGNLVFFLAFAGAVEVFIAHTGKFLLSLFAIEVGLDFSWSIAMLSSPAEVTLGLSGVVSGMIGFLAYAIPRGQIRCLFGILFYFWHGTLAVWVLALWYVGWDVFYLFTTGASSVNYLAHVMGALFGYGIAGLFYRQRKGELQENIDKELIRYQQERVHRVGRF